MSDTSKGIAQWVKGQLWVHFQGRTFIYENEKSQFAKKQKGKSGNGNILSPMPGKVTKVVKAVNDNVVPGDVVLVMEAMKMEYTLKADVEGAIEAVHCKAGDQVALGATLVKVKVKK